ncbi:aldose epimerase family protein [Spirochaetia bacterium 38H-sp]|uniref:Aldose 1-epimerase n=1 Tax=Rarispira pelagica TaxID=3141764 RepID=A0ABU9U8E5_9SPIR
MKIKTGTFGKTEAGEVKYYMLTNKNGYSCTIINYGATLVSFKMPDRHGKTEEITLGFDNIQDYLTRSPYFGATIGRFANRISRAAFTIDGTEYKLIPNEGENQLHGGPGGLHTLLWDGDVFNNDYSATIVLSCSSPDGDQGYPGNLSVTTSYTLTENNELVMEYLAETDKKTHVNLTNHAYWNLAGAGSGKIYDHILYLDCTHYLPVDNESIPTGEKKQVTGTAFDFTTEKPIGRDIEKIPPGYDHCMVLREHNPYDPVAFARVEEPSSGRCMEISTTKPGVQFYTGNHLNDIEIADKKIARRHEAFCLETQYFPDTPNKENFPSSLLEPDKTYRQKTVYKFFTK